MVLLDKNILTFFTVTLKEKRINTNLLDNFQSFVFNSEKISENAVLNANYLLSRIRDHYTLTYDRICMHEFVVEGHWKDAPGIHAMDIAKRLMDYGFHPPTNYFPLIVPEALMVEPTETENMQTLDKYADTLIKIAEEAVTDPDLLQNAPHNSPIGRLDEVKAARDLIMCCSFPLEE